MINEQKEYMNWKKNFLLPKYKEEKSLRMKEYEDDKIRKDEKHSIEMRVLKLKELKLICDLGLKRTVISQTYNCNFRNTVDYT